MDDRSLVFVHLFFGYRKGHRNNGPHKVHGSHNETLSLGEAHTTRNHNVILKAT